MTWDYSKYDNKFSTKVNLQVRHIDMFVLINARAGMTIEMLGYDGERLTKLRRVRDDIDVLINAL